MDGTEEGGGGNCWRGSGFGAKDMAGATKLTELPLSLTAAGWLSTGRDDLSFPAGGAALGSVLTGWMGGCEMGPTGC